jgi:predicted ArsR family transcriptional regulator
MARRRDPSRSGMSRPPASEVPVGTRTGLADQQPSDSGRRRILDILRSAPAPLGVTDLATRAGLHTNTVRFHLDRLVTDGLVTREVEPRGRPGRPRLTFAAVPEEDIGGGRRSYQLLAEMLAGYLAETTPDAATPAVGLGQAWGRYLARRLAPSARVTEEESLAELLRVLEDIGFAPLLAEDDGGPPQVLLRHCPFREVASAHPDVVCSLHLGVMQGVLAEQRAPVEATELQPFVQPSLCVGHLARHAPSHSPAG